MAMPRVSLLKFLKVYRGCYSIRYVELTFSTSRFLVSFFHRNPFLNSL